MPFVVAVDDVDTSTAAVDNDDDDDNDDVDDDATANDDVGNGISTIRGALILLGCAALVLNTYSSE